MLKKLICLMFLSPLAFSAEYYVATDGNNGNVGSEAAPWATFAYAFSHMTAGDTLWIKDGTYTQQLTGMPSGSGANYTQVKAVNNWAVTVVYAMALYVNSKSSVTIEGIHFDGNNLSEAGTVAYSDHVKVIRCSFSNAHASEANWNVGTFVFTDCDYVLAEECFAWGTGRMKFISYVSRNVIFRRCVARHDYHPSHQCALFHRYSSTNVEFQNCIGIDSGMADMSNGHLYAAIYNDNHDPVVANTGKNLGCVLLNIDDGAGIYDISIDNATRTIEHCVVWDTPGAMDISKHEYGYGVDPSYAYINHCTVGDAYAPPGWEPGTGIFEEGGEWNMDVFSVSNTIITQNITGIKNVTFSNYNCFYDNDTNYSGVSAGANDNTNNPGLQYIVRAESGSGNASDSGYIGATILYQYGTAGTLWGETGYETLTEVPLWPFPNEDVIKTKMAANDFEWEDWASGDAGTINGDRGFAATGTQLNGVDDITLTSYIWEYLGNQMPDDIYGEPGVDVTSPTISNVSATVHTSSAVVVYTTNENADIKVDYGTTTGYGANVTSAAYTTSHSIAITGLDSETLYHYRITTKDSTGNTTVSGDYNFTTRGEGAAATDTIYVSPTGNDTSGSGTEASPYLTIQRAVNEAQAGDTVLVANGTYNGFETVNSGTDGNPITIKANGNAVIVNYRNARTLDNINIEGTDWIVLDGFISTDSARGGIRCVESEDCVIKNNQIVNAEVWGVLTGFAPRVEITSNTCWGSVQQHGIYVSNSRIANDNPVVRGNVCYGNNWNGIQVNGDAYTGGDGSIDGAIVEQNICHDNGYKGINIISASSSTFRNNLLYNNGSLGGAGAISITDEPGTEVFSVCNVICNNTIIEPNIAGIRFYDTTEDPDTVDNTGNFCFNNIVVSPLGIVDESTGNNIGENLVGSSSTGLFTNEAIFDFTLAEDSPAIDAGVATYEGKSAPTTDFAGMSRPAGAGYDIGAYEYQSESPEEPATVGITIQGVTITGGFRISAD